MQVFTVILDQAYRKTTPQRRRKWKAVLYNLLQYTDEELALHRERQTQEWENWCNNVVLFYAYNNIIFKEKAPMITIDDLCKLDPEDIARTEYPQGNTHDEFDSQFVMNMKLAQECGSKTSQGI